MNYNEIELKDTQDRDAFIRSVLRDAFRTITAHPDVTEVVEQIRRVGSGLRCVGGDGKGVPRDPDARRRVGDAERSQP
jgi:hypothetical protein